MSTLLRNISTSESNLYLRELMLSCAIINLLVFFDLMFSIFVEGSRFNSCVNVDEVLWSNKNDSSLSKLASFKTRTTYSPMVFFVWKLWKTFRFFVKVFLKKMIKIATITTPSIILREKLRYTICKSYGPIPVKM